MEWEGHVECRTGRDMHRQLWWENLRERDRFENLGADLKEMGWEDVH
jgi:hypothetical protein